VKAGQQQMASLLQASTPRVHMSAEGLLGANEIAVSSNETAVSSNEIRVWATRGPGENEYGRDHVWTREGPRLATWPSFG
jgi:hypothetical protein